LLLTYTDGLIERRDASIEDGMARLLEVVRADHPEDVCRDVMRALFEGSTPDDDVALLAIRRRSAGYPQQATVLTP
jgi:serine phosphatase RsbU (regulator of sigma subunit)